jgi:hypothetical protein
MHIILLVVVGVLIAHVIMGMSRNFGGCLLVLILLLIIGSCASHHTVVYHY